MEETVKKKSSMNKVLKELFSTAIYILVVFAITWLLITFVGQRTIVDGDSMNDTLQNGDSLWVDKISYRFSDPQRYDIVVFPPRNENEKHYIKRVIGLPGENVKCDVEGHLYINDVLLVENYGMALIDENHYGRLLEGITLGDDEYFVMGDNRNNSLDSRYEIVGSIHKDEFTGKAVFRLYPFSKFGKID